LANIFNTTAISPVDEILVGKKRLLQSVKKMSKWRTDSCGKTKGNFF